MVTRLWIAIPLILAGFSVAVAAPGVWWNPKWRFRTAVTRPGPYRDEAPRPIEVAVEFPLLLRQGAASGEFDPASIRVIDRSGREVPSAYRTEVDVTTGQKRGYVTWIARPKVGQAGGADIYFDTKDRGIEPANYDSTLLPPENLLRNPGFEDGGDGWDIDPKGLVSFGKFADTTGAQSLKIVVDEKTPKDVKREVALSQKVDVRELAGQEMLFECDLLAERAAYGAPVCIEIQQFRADGSQIMEYAVDPRWLTIEMAAGQFVQFSERGQFSHDAATANVCVRFRCYVTDADSRQTVEGPESFFTIWVDRVMLRGAERWPWPEATNGGFVEGALKTAPFNRGFKFTGQRRLVFNGASEGSLTAGQLDAGPKSVHWGLQSGTLEFWCRPSWNADDGIEHIFFKGSGYLYRLQSLLRKCDAKENNALEFAIADADQNLHKVRGPAPLRKGQWAHIAATWDLPKAHLQLFVDGKHVAEEGPGVAPWPGGLAAKDDSKAQKGIGVAEEDKRSIPMQAFIGGHMDNKVWPKDQAAEAVLDEFRISDAVRYAADFAPPTEEFRIDDDTRALWHFENERHGVHGGDDRFVRSYLGCEIPPQREDAPLEILKDGKMERRMVVVRPYAPDELFEANRGEKRLNDDHPFREMPDPRFVAYRERRAERIVAGKDDEFTVKVEGDFAPLMGGVTFERADGSSSQTTLLPRWRANDNVAPFSAESIAATLAPDAKTDAEKAVAVMRYSNETGAYFDAHYCETLPCGVHRPRVSYTFLKALNIYPYDQCGPSNFTLRKLFLAVGISSNNAPGTHHQFQQAFYKGSQRLFDLASRMYWLNRDNETVASLRGIGEDPFCKLRQPGSLNSYYPGRPGRAAFGVAERPHSMDFPLRPGERASVCWVNEGKWFELTGEREPIPLAKVPPFFGNGTIVYEPVGAGEAVALDNMAVDGAALSAKDSTKPASLIYRAQCPYILTDAKVTGGYSAQQPGTIRMALSFDQGKTWTDVWRSPDKAGAFAVDMRDQVSARYAYWLKLELAPDADAKVPGLKVRTTFLNSVLCLPGTLALGENRIRFVFGKPTVPIKTTCSWTERHKTDLGVSLNALSYYNLDYARHRNVFVAAPGGDALVQVALEGRKMKGKVSLDGLPGDWTAKAGEQPIEVADPKQSACAQFLLHIPESADGDVRAFDVVVREGDKERRIPAEVFVARSALVREAEKADKITGGAAVVDILDVSGRKAVAFKDKGELQFDLDASLAGPHALWLRARWELETPPVLRLTIDEGKPRDVRAYRMIGFTDWTDARNGFTKGFLHYPKEHEHWAWYRIPDIELTKGKHRMAVGAGSSGAFLDALLLLPQTPGMDRAAMNLFHNWNYAPQENPL